MTRLVRMVGFLLIGAGTLILASYLIKPLRFMWPWLRALPLPVQLGLGAAVFGFILLMGSVLWERLEDREEDRDLLNE